MSTNPNPFGGGGGQQPWQFLPESYGAKGNGKIVSDGAITSGTNTLTCATSAPFAPGDVGKVITVEAAGTTLTGTSTQSALSTTIASFISATQVTLTANAGNTVSGRTVCFGNDDTAGIQGAINAAAAYATANHYFAEIVFKALTYMIGGALVQGGTTKCNAQITLPVVPITGNPTMTLKFTGVRCNAGNPMFQASSDTPATASDGTILCSTLTGQTYSGTFGQPAVISGPTVEQGFTGGNTNLWNNLMPVVDGITVLVQPIASVTGLDFTSCCKAEVPWYRAFAAAPANVLAVAGYNPVWASGQAFAHGLNMPQGGNNAHCVIGSAGFQGFNAGLMAYEHTNWQDLTCVSCGSGLFANDSVAGHGIAGLRYCAENNTNHINFNTSGNHISVDIVSLMAENNSAFAAGFTINDSGNSGYGRIGVQTASAGQLTVNGAANLEIILSRAGTGAQTRGLQTPPAVPATTVALLNPFWKHCKVYLTSGGAAVSAIAVNGTATGLTLGTSGTIMVPVPTGATITLTYASTAPTWQWFAD